MKRSALGLALLLSCAASAGFADEGAVPSGVPYLDHVYVIVMENHGYSQIFNNPNAPFTNSYAQSVNSATNYFAVAHPSLTNYLEIVGASNFGVHSDNYPAWHSTSCTTNLASGTLSTDVPSSPTICPITGSGLDADYLDGYHFSDLEGRYVNIPGDTMTGYFDALGPRLGHVHLTDGEVGRLGSGHLAWGDGSLPLSDYLEVLEAHDYRGFLTLEALNSRYIYDPDSALHKGVSALRAYLS